MDIIKKLAQELAIKEEQAKAAVQLIDEGNTIPFIARYRKEMTGALNDETLRNLHERLLYLRNLEEKKEQVINAITDQGKMTEDLKKKILSAETLVAVDDLYRPYRPKKQTRATKAKEKGLEPLANILLLQKTTKSMEEEAAAFVNAEKGVANAKEAIAGAKDIIAEMVSDNAKQRWAFKDTILKSGVLATKIKKDAKDENKVYEMYYDRSEKISQLADHRIMAIDRAEKEKVITVSFVFDEEYLEEEAYKNLMHGNATSIEKELKDACVDGCTRLLFPSIEREIRSELSEKAQNQSIEIFSMNLEKLLLQAPLKGRIVLGFDPGFYNGCKLAVIDETGKMLTVDKVYPFRTNKENPEAIDAAKKKVLSLIEKYHVQIIAIGNGTASRESEKLCAELIHDNHLDVQYAIVSEAGASVWSAQEAARLEFPDMAIEERSAVSIGRRLLDPLAELIKIDPQSIGVGQYQHDLPQKALTQRLDEVVMKAVNRTGADLNTASVELLTHISGLNAGIAKEIINYRNENGKFTNRKQLLKVKKLGPKAYTQCAGFLRITDGDEPLDETSIHPESYDAAREVMKACGITKLGEKDAEFPADKTKDLGIDSYTLADIEDAIKQPLRDYRDQFDGALLKSDVLEISDLHKGDQLSGTVRNVVDFGAFVDIGLHQDGLAHISHMSMNRVSHPSEIVSVGDIITVWVYDIDEARGRVQLSLLPLDQLEQRDAQMKRKKSSKDKKKYSKKPEKKKMTMDDAMANLLARFGK